MALLCAYATQGEGVCVLSGRTGGGGRSGGRKAGAVSRLAWFSDDVFRVCSSNPARYQAGLENW